MQRRPTMLCTFFENGFLKQKTKTEAKFGPLSIYQNIIGSRTRTDTHIDGEVIGREWHEGPLCDRLYRLPAAVCLQNF